MAAFIIVDRMTSLSPMHAKIWIHQSVSANVVVVSFCFDVIDVHSVIYLALCVRSDLSCYTPACTCAVQGGPKRYQFYHDMILTIVPHTHTHTHTHTRIIVNA